MTYKIQVQTTAITNDKRWDRRLRGTTENYTRDETSDKSKDTPRCKDNHKTITRQDKTSTRRNKRQGPVPEETKDKYPKR